MVAESARGCKREHGGARIESLCDTEEVPLAIRQPTKCAIEPTVRQQVEVARPQRFEHELVIVLAPIVPSCSRQVQQRLLPMRFARICYTMVPR